MAAFHFDTPRLRVRDWIPEDWQLVWALASDPGVTRYQTWLRLEDEDACKKWISDAIHHNQLEPRVAYNTAVVLKDGDRAIGWLGWGTGGNQNLVWRGASLKDDPEYGHGSFGYALLPEEWNHGYMTEAVRGMVQYAYDVLGMQSLRASCATSNRASARVLENAGLKLLHRRLERDESLDIEEEHSYYRLERADWRP
jgi:RimJ/RimL family protein N-acetyltransferase